MAVPLLKLGSQLKRASSRQRTLYLQHNPAKGTVRLHTLDLGGDLQRVPFLTFAEGWQAPPQIPKPVSSVAISIPGVLA